MPLNKSDTEILEQIVSLDGKCMDSKRCPLCPFRGICIPEFIYPNPPTQSQRHHIALSALTHHALISTIEEDTLKVEDYTWDKK